MSSQAALIAAFFGSDPHLRTPLSPPRVFHELPAPVVTFDGKTHTITIFRKDGTWLNNFFEYHTLSVCGGREKELSPLERDNIKGPAAPDGMMYYIRATPHAAPFSRPAAASFIWLQSEEEAIAVGKAVQEAEDTQRYLELKEGDCICCTFCRKARSICGEDHGDEMRDWQREALERD
jgi:hypothetical protein